MPGTFFGVTLGRQGLLASPGVAIVWSGLTKGGVMPNTVYNLYEAKSALSSLVERVAAGEEIYIAKAGRPMARLVPLPPARREPGAWKGRWKGRGWIGDDFDEPLPADLLDAFSGEQE